MTRQVGPGEFKDLMAKGWMTPASAARRWGVSERTVFVWLKRHRLEAVQHVTDYFYLIDPAQRRP